MTDRHNSIFHTPEKTGKMGDTLSEFSTESREKNANNSYSSKFIGSTPDLKSTTPLI
jgi:hypothetical protein